MSATIDDSMPTPERIFGTLNAYQQTAALKTAIELDVFTVIGQGMNSTAALAQKCQASERGIRTLCDFLVIHGFLEKNDHSYELTPDAAIFLNKKSPAYLGSAVNFLTLPELMDAFKDLTAIVRNGGSLQGDATTTDPDSLKWVEFARSMAPLQTLAAEGLAEMLNASAGAKWKVLDIAAGHGMYGVTIARHNPAAKIHALDWKNVLAVAHENAVKFGTADRWHAIEGSAFTTDYGSGYDAVLVTNFIHHFDVPTNIGLFEKIRAAMKPGGKMAIVEMAVNDDRVTPAGAGMLSTTMLTTTPTGDAYSQREIETMCTRAGFHDVAHHAVPATPQTVTIAMS